MKTIKICKMCNEKKLITKNKLICNKCRLRLNKELKPCPKCGQNSLYYSDRFEFFGNFSYRIYYCENCDYSKEVELDCG